MKKTFLWSSLTLFTGFGVLFFLAAATAVPRYSARYEQNCNLCHTNPTGGGMRSLYASQYLVPEEMVFRNPGGEFMEQIDPQLSGSITMGSDFRLLHVYSDEKNQVKNFFQMQGDIYIGFQMGPRLSLYYDHGISQSYELFGLGYLLPHNGYIKIGRFLPDYGWKFDDHTMFVRDKLGFFPPSHTDVGVELGMYPNRFALTVGVMNGAGGSSQDENSDVAVIGRAMYRFNVLGIAAGVGGSALRNPRIGAEYEAIGPFGYLGWKRLTWLGEWDWYHVDPTNATDRWGLVLSQELTFLVQKGIEIKATYDFYDPDVDVETGKEDRFGGGVFVFLNPFVGIELLGRQYEFENGFDISGRNYFESVVQFHLLF